MKEFIIPGIGEIASLAPVRFSIYKYFDNKNREQKEKEFECFHKLIKELV